jgi:CBS domain-containing protein
VASDEEIDYWEARPDPSDEDIVAVCRAWVRYQERALPVVDENDPDWWAAEALMDLESRRSPSY